MELKLAAFFSITKYTANVFSHKLSQGCKFSSTAHVI